MNQKKNTKLLILLIILIVVLIIGVVITYIVLATDMFKSDKQIFFNYITKIRDEKKGFISNEVVEYFRKQKNTSYENNGNITFNITSSENGEQFDNINKCNINISGKVDKANQKSIEDIDINYSNDVKLSVSYRNTGNIFGLQNDNIGSKFIAIKTDELDRLQTNTGVNIGDIKLSNESELVSKDKLQYIQETYYNLLNQELKDENFVKIIEDNQKGYKLTLSGEELKSIIVKSFEIIKNDQIILDCINEYTKAIGLEEIKTNSIDGLINTINSNSEISNEKFEMTLFIDNKMIKKIVISIKECKITIEKDESANTKQYNISSEVYQNNTTTKVYLNAGFSGLQSLQSITENWELGIIPNDNSQYIYYFNNNVDFIENADIEEITEDNSLILTQLESEQASNLINAIIERIQNVNSKQMESLGLTGNENPLIYAIPSFFVSSAQSMTSIDDVDIEMNNLEIDSYNNSFLNYESLDAKGVTVKGLLSTIQNNNELYDKNEVNHKIKEINFNGDEYEVKEDTILLIKSEIVLEDTYKIEFEKDPNTGLIYRVVINKN